MRKGVARLLEDFLSCKAQQLFLKKRYFQLSITKLSVTFRLVRIFSVKCSSLR